MEQGWTAGLREKVVDSINAVLRKWGEMVDELRWNGGGKGKQASYRTEMLAWAASRGE
jgi:hypothetical protein